MKLLCSAIAFALPLTALASEPPPPKQGWSGSGEAGLAAASGNTKSENINAKIDIKYNDDHWKDDFYLLAQRNKTNVAVNTSGSGSNPPTTTTQYELTANRYETGASAGYKLDDHSYVVGALRYEHDAFSPYDYQSIASLGYGYQALKNAHDELAFEVGAGLKTVQPTSRYIANPAPPPDLLKLRPDSDSSAAGRGKVDYKHSFNANTSLVDTLLVENASGNTFVQNDAGLAVKMNSSLALKLGYQLRHNTEVAEGFKHTDQLVTTNLVYGF
jgi:putative salt-induced outer membrane protein